MSKCEEARPIEESEKGVESAQTVVDTQGNSLTKQLSQRTAPGSDV